MTKRQKKGPGAQPAPATPLGRRIALPAACAILVFLAFRPTLGFQFLDWDDRHLLVENPHWRDLGSACFLLLTVLAYLRSSALEGRRRTRWLVGSLALYLVSMVSKVGGAPLPLVLLVLEWYPLGRLDPRRERKRVLLGLLPFL